MKERNYTGTIGVITPHREQASLVHTTLTTSDLSEWLEERKLKVMTFDTCQGEERDYIFYSMVATENDDKHRYVFPQTLEGTSDIEESRVRVQRLNVGFSRAKETIHFILSKDIDKYWGSIRDALSFYEHKLNDAVSITVGGTDPNSKMEEKIQHCFYETKFYKNSDEKIELIPQFPLGDYLRSLDRKYNHPSYKVDFLMLFGKQKIVIEYDGFKEHFIDGEGITKHNYESYLKEEDIYRQKVLEGYGYKFIRLNKFNLGNNPIEAFDEMLTDCVKKKTQARQLLTTS
jgi:very-short-patch-repair endonuclease